MRTGYEKQLLRDDAAPDLCFERSACLVLPAADFVIVYPSHVAHVAELADALDSGSSE